MSQGMYIQLFSVHGLVRAHNLEMGRDADTGGQILYVLELARALSEREEIRKVDFFTRYIQDKSVSDDYSVPVEEVNEKLRIIRIQAGGKKYLRKEQLWPFLDEFVDKTIKFIQSENDIPDIVHGHYADAGYIVTQLAQVFSLPFFFTGHSLGRAKKERLMMGGVKLEDLEKKYKISARINAEEEVLKRADMIITSTNQEVKEQYGMYENNNFPSYRVIPPGLNIEKFYPYYYDQISSQKKDEIKMQAYVSLLDELKRFFKNPDKPLILTLCRPDKRKNISGLIQAYGECNELQAIANLAIFAGIRKDISNMEENERDVLTEMLLMMDKYDLYGKMAIPKRHDFEYEVPELYRIAAGKTGVFVNAAFTEPFGLTLIEASATGLPIVATDDGGPRDIISNLKNGILVDVRDTKNISDAITSIITDRNKWKKYSENGTLNIKNYYTWEAHVESYLKEVQILMKGKKKEEFQINIAGEPIGKRLSRLQDFIITDIDDTLIGKDNTHLEEFIDIINKNRSHIGFGVSTGRTILSAIEQLRKYNIPQPDVLFTSVGSELYYGSALHYDQGWDSHLSYKWEPEKIYEVLKDVDFLSLQDDEVQTKYKISYLMKPGKDRLTKVHDILLKNKISYRLVYALNEYLDILPSRASKGKGIRYLSYKWGIPLEHIMVSGNSGNDEEMLRGNLPAVVVANYSPELEVLKGMKNVYFAQQPSSGGIIEGLEHYHFIEKVKNGS